MEHEHEEVEQIPWAMLADELDGGRRKTLGMIALAVVGALVAGVLAVTMLRRTGGTTVDLAPGSTEVPAAAGPSAVAEEPTLPAEPAATASEADMTAPPAPALYTEADLMAVLPEDDLRLIAARAEWFVADFFTVLGPDDPVDGLDASLPRPVAEDEGYSWVEWVRTSEVVGVAPGEYEATVLFRALRRNGGELLRTAVRAVALRLRMDSGEGIAVVGLPSPALVPVSAAAPSIELQEPPPEVAAAALARVSGLGRDAAVEGAVATETGWTVVVSVADASLVRWPLQVDVAADGSGPES